MSLAFIPRKLAPKRTAAPSTPVPPPPVPPVTNASNKGKEKESAGPSAEDCAALFRLALSDYALWSDAQLRMKLSSTEEGPAYVPLHYLLHHSQVLAPLRSVPQTLLVKHLKGLLSDVLDFRMLLGDPSPWFNPTGSSSSQKAGGYEVQLKTYDPASSPTYSKSDWEKRTIYIENVPVHYRTIAALTKFIEALLPAPKSASPSFHESASRIQNIYLPPHHRDKPGDAPTFKGFAVVTFLHESDAQHILTSWIWHPTDTPSPSKVPSGKEPSEAVKDAVNFGFRSTNKSHWEALRTEYLLYRQQLVEEINAYQDSQSAPAPPPPQPSASTSTHRPPKVDSSHEEKESSGSRHAAGSAPNADVAKQVITLSSPYPYGCLVFIKNIHHETNKTTLKSLFGKVLSNSGGSSKGGIDYVDFNKGMDTCHLRLSTPECSQTLQAHFSFTPTVQASGLDDTGSPAKDQPNVKPISVEIVSGTREDMYWQKVPEKIRFGAVQKAVQQIQSSCGKDEATCMGTIDTTKDGSADNRPKKRRKR